MSDIKTAVSAIHAESIYGAPYNAAHAHVGFQIYVPTACPVDDFAPYEQYCALLVSDYSTLGLPVSRHDNHARLGASAAPTDPLRLSTDTRLITFETHFHSAHCEGPLRRRSHYCNMPLSKRRSDPSYPILCHIPYNVDRFVPVIKCAILKPFDVQKLPLSDVFVLLRELRYAISRLDSILPRVLMGMVMQYHSYNPPA